MSLDDSIGFDDFEAHLDELKVHSTRNLGAAKKKPLLLLLLVSKLYRGEVPENTFRFSELEEELADLIVEFGGRISKPKPEQPFYHLSSSSIWGLTSDLPLPPGNSRTASLSVLRDASTRARLPSKLYSELAAEPQRCLMLASLLMNRYWSETLHPELKAHFGLPDDLRVVSARKRDPAFVFETLLNYNYRCAACGFRLLLKDKVVGLDAAHIQWHAFGGPDVVENGLALCKFHHWALDKGVIGVEPGSLTIVVSKAATPCDRASERQLTELQGKTIEPGRIVPGDRFLMWQMENRFLG